jgi:hypothetical protein
MSFLVDPPLLYAAGRSYATSAPESAQGDAAKLAGAATVAVFVAASVGLWTNQPWAKPMWLWSRARSGREFQATTGLVRWDGSKRPPREAHALAAAGFLTYPVWWWLGWDAGRRRRSL